MTPGLLVTTRHDLASYVLKEKIENVESLVGAS